MSDPNAAVCFTCGQPSGDLLRLNTMPNGQVCPTCRDRLLEGIPAALPSEEAFSEESETLTGGSGEDDEESDRQRFSATRGPGQLLLGGGPNEPA